MDNHKLNLDLPSGIMAKQNVYHNVNVALRYYRYLRAFCENAVDTIDWYVNDRKMPTYIEAIAKTRLETMTILTHINQAMETYKALCEAEGSIRPALVLEKKFMEPLGGSDGRGKPYTNMELAELFKVDRRTIDRDIRAGKTKMSILLFGIYGLNHELRFNNTSELCSNDDVDRHEIL